MHRAASTNNPFRRKSPTLDSVTFSVDGWRPLGEREPGRVRIWFTGHGDGVSLNYFARPPDLPVAQSLDGLWAGLDALSGGVKSVERHIVSAGGCPAIRRIVKVPQQPAGLTYIGSLTIPFRDFSFVVKAQCSEHGNTGLRDALLIDRMLGAGHALVGEGGRLVFVGADPDTAQFDTEFPDHPVSRARAFLNDVLETIRVDPAIRKLPKFPLPSAVPD